jgi:tRNA threonylcarbamoyladenosine biosynthesis protein TsaE
LRRGFPIVTQSEAETASAGRDLASTLGSGAVVLLSGDLGAGKTAFVRGMAEGLGIDPQEVSSPTFTLVQEYRGGRLPLFHIDLYRLQPREVDDLGLDEIARSGGVMAIEWPDRLPRPLEDAIKVTIEYIDERSRSIEVASRKSQVSSRDL